MFLNGKQLTSSYFLIEFINSRCFFSSSSWATFCSLSWSFCCVTDSSSLSHAFSWQSLFTWAFNFCFSASTVLRWLHNAIMTWQNISIMTKLTILYSLDINISVNIRVFHHSTKPLCSKDPTFKILEKWKLHSSFFWKSKAQGCSQWKSSIQTHPICMPMSLTQTLW